MILLIHPPVVKPSEAPAGLAALAGALACHDVPVSVLDANLEGLLYLMGASSVRAGDRWTRRAFNGRLRQLATLRSLQSYTSPDRYRRAVADLNRLVAMAAANTSVRLNLTNYSDSLLAPTNSADLQQAFENPAANPFHDYFTTRLNTLLADRQPAQVGVSLNYLSQALCAFAMLGYLRQGWPGLTLLLGGGLVTSWMRQPGWRNPFTGWWMN